MKVAIEGLPENPNEYDDDRFTQGSLNLHESIATLWNSGADDLNLKSEIENALENAV